MTLDFVGAHGDALGAMAIENGVLRAEMPAARANMAAINGHEVFALGGYDFFAIAGCKISIFQMLALYRQVRFLSLPSMASIDDIEAVEHQLISEPAAKAALVDMLRASFGLRFCAQLAAAMAKPGVTRWNSRDPRSRVCGYRTGALRASGARCGSGMRPR